MELTVRTNRLHRCYADSAVASKEWGVEVARKYINRIDILYAVASSADLLALPHLEFHPLKGKRHGEYAITLHGRWRLIVSFEDKRMTVVSVREVNNHYGD